MSITLSSYIIGDLDYVSKLNSDNAALTTAIDALQSATSVVQYDVAMFYPGIPTASALLCRLRVPRAMKMPASLVGSFADARVAATASTVFTIAKNGTSVGTITFNPSSSLGAFTFAADQTFAAGDTLTVTAPGTPDVTLADVSFTLVASKL